MSFSIVLKTFFFSVLFEVSVLVISIFSLDTFLNTTTYIKWVPSTFLSLFPFSLQVYLFNWTFLFFTFSTQSSSLSSSYPNYFNLLFGLFLPKGIKVQYFELLNEIAIFLFNYSRYFELEQGDSALFSILNCQFNLSN